MSEAGFAAVGALNCKQCCGSGSNMDPHSAIVRIRIEKRMLDLLDKHSDHLTVIQNFLNCGISFVWFKKDFFLKNKLFEEN